MKKFNTLKFVQYLVVIGIILNGSCFFYDLNKQHIKEKSRLQEKHKEEIEELKEEREAYVQELIQKEEVLDKYQNKLNDVSIECANLENTIKDLASVGKKPQNYRESEKVDRGSFERLYDDLEYVGEWLGTYYAPTKEECGNNKGLTASGKPVIAGHTIAIDKHYWKLGTMFYLEGYGICEGIDTGGAIKGRNRLDYCVFSSEISHSGSFKVKVWLIKNK